MYQVCTCNDNPSVSTGALPSCPMHNPAPVGVTTNTDGAIVCPVCSTDVKQSDKDILVEMFKRAGVELDRGFEITDYIWLNGPHHSTCFSFSKSGDLIDADVN